MSHLELVALVVRDLVASGVRFVLPPRDEPYGRLAVFLDLEGNRWDLLGPDQIIAAGLR